MADLLKNKIKIFEDIFYFSLQLKFSMFKFNKARHSLGLEIYSSLKVKQIDCLRGVYMHHACLQGMANLYCMIYWLIFFAVTTLLL